MWSNSKLMFKLGQQLTDPLALVCGALPEWIDALMRTSHFLFPLSMRSQYFWCSAFGCARAVVWLKQQQPQGAGSVTGFEQVGPLRIDRCAAHLALPWSAARPM
eukprot:SAG11_NODE_1532_length_4732_cov_4.721563_2_plen_104_part_00